MKVSSPCYPASIGHSINDFGYIAKTKCQELCQNSKKQILNLVQEPISYYIGVTKKN